MFTTLGNKAVDCCEHEHETRDEAQLCLLEHHKLMRLIGKVSTRQVVELDSMEEIEDFY